MNDPARTLVFVFGGGLLAVSILLALVFAGVASAGRSGNPNECPIGAPTDAQPGVSMDRKLEHGAWRRAKSLAGAPKGWKKPGRASRYFDFYVDDEGDIYAGFHIGPWPYLDSKTGRPVFCEYIQVWLPEDALEADVRHVLIHEYLHAIAPRMLEFNEGKPIAANCSSLEVKIDGCEDWVRELWPMSDSVWATQ